MMEWLVLWTMAGMVMTLVGDRQNVKKGAAIFAWDEVALVVICWPAILVFMLHEFLKARGT